MYLIYWPMGVMISLVGSYDSDYANYYQIIEGSNLTIKNMESCFDYIQIDVLTDNGVNLELNMNNGAFCSADYSSPCMVQGFSSGPINVISSDDGFGTATKFSLLCNTNFKETLQFYTNALSILCCVLAFALVGGCLLVTVFHNLVVCMVKTFRKPERETESLTGRRFSPPSYSQKQEYQSIQ